eukprot:Pgem_evm1s19085
MFMSPTTFTGNQVLATDNHAFQTHGSTPLLSTSSPHHSQSGTVNQPKAASPLQTSQTMAIQNLSGSNHNSAQNSITGEKNDVPATVNSMEVI